VKTVSDQVLGHSLTYPCEYDYIENDRFAFLSPFGGLGATYDVNLRLTGKRVVDVFLV